MKTLKPALALAVLGTPVLAHPGHDAAPLTHWVGDLSHLAVTLALAAVAVVAVAMVTARSRSTRDSKANRRQSE